MLLDTYLDSFTQNERNEGHGRASAEQGVMFAVPTLEA